MFSKSFKGIELAVKGLIVVCLVSVPFGLWKIWDLIVGLLGE
jgi:hypothetical protein